MDQEIQQSSNSSSEGVVQPITTGLNVGTSQQILYNQKTAKIFGGTQIIIGIIHVLMNLGVFFSYVAVNILRFIGYGIWGGALFIVAGVVQFLSARTAENVSLITGTLVMCVISACACAIGFPYGIIEAIGWGFFSSTSSQFLASLLAVLAFMEAVIAILSSVMCCKAICNLKPAMTAIPVHAVGNQKVTYQANNPGSSPEKASAPQV